jgi:hypothetical protein
MTTHAPTQLKKPTPRRPLKPRPAVAVALGAAVAVVLIGAVLLLGVTDGSDDAASLGEIPTVQAAADGWNAYDADAYADHWAEGASGYGPFGPSRSGVFTRVGSPEMEEALDAFRAAGGQISLSDCTLSDATVTCVETHDDLRYGGSITLGARYALDEEGKIISLTYTNATPVEVEVFHNAFARWMEEAHPESLDTYFVPGFYSLKIDGWQTPESVANLMPLIQEFIAQSDEYPLSQ